MEENPAKTWQRIRGMLLTLLDPSLKSCQKRSQQKGGCRKPILKKGNKGKRLSYTKLQKKRAENHTSYLVIFKKKQFKLSLICIEETRREVEQWVYTTINKTRWMFCCGLGQPFSHCWWGFYQNWWKFEHSIIRFWFNMQYHLKYVWLPVACFFSAWQCSQTHCQCSRSIHGQKKCTIRRGQSTTGSLAPQHYWSKVWSFYREGERKAAAFQRKALNVSLED